MKRKLLLSSAVVPSLLASGAMGQVVNFEDANNNFPLQSQVGLAGGAYCELFAGQGAYTDPGNDIWNGFGNYGFGYKSTGMYSGSPGTGPNWAQQEGNPGNPYAAFNAGGGWVTSTGPSLFDFSSSPTTSGDCTSAGVWTPITLSITAYGSDNGNPASAGLTIQDGDPAFLLLTSATNASKAGSNPNEVFVLQNVPAGTYGLYLYGANFNNNRGTLFSLNSGNAHNGIAATLNGQNGTPAPTFVEGQNFVIFENVTPDGSGNITITASPNPAAGVGNSNIPGVTDVNGFQLIFNPPPTAVGATVAQNVLAGGTASFYFSPAFAPSATLQWQSVISGVTKNLTDGGQFSGSTTTNLVISNVGAGNVGLYQCVITAGAATGTSPGAPLTILTSPANGPVLPGDATTVVGNILQPGDILSDFNNNFGYPFNSVPPPFNMAVLHVEDNTLDQYVSFGANGSSPPFIGPAGFIVTPNAGASIVTGLRFFTSSSHPEDDPSDYLLEGSNDGTNNFTAISGGVLALPAQRNAAGGVISVNNDALQEVDFANTKAYSAYRVTFTNVNDNDTASNGVQIAEIQLLGSLAPLAPGITQQPPPSQTLLVGATLTVGVVASGPGPFTYQWYYNTSTKLSGATNATFALPNLTTNNSGSYSCTIGNGVGPTTSSALNLTVVTPTPYQKTLLSFNPMSYWPLNETSGTTAFDNVNSHNGTYSSGNTLGQPGVAFKGFGASSLSVTFDGATGKVDVPEGSFNIQTPVTLITWIQTSAGGFADILGHGDSSYRITVNNGAPGFADGNDNGDATSGTADNDGNWHMVAGVYTGGDGSTANGFAYVDGLLVASNKISSVPGNGLDLWIGGAPDYGNGRLFNGNLAHAAVFDYALTGDQIQQIYGGAEPAPTIIVPSAPVTVDENGNGSINVSVTGEEPFYYQWEYLNASDVAVVIAGATNSSLLLTDVQLAQQQYQYYVVVSNASGVTTSSVVGLNILSGGPVISPDVSPLFTEVPVGVPVTFSVGAAGTEPFHYHWVTNNTQVPGATNSSFTFNALPGSNDYYVIVSNSDGSSNSSTGIVLGLTNPPPIISFNGYGPNWTVNQGATTLPTFTNNVLTLTVDVGGEAGSAFFADPQYIGGFFASYTYQATGTGTLADGVTFCMQNSTNGVDAVGAGGGDLGYTGIAPSAAFELNIYPYANGGVGIDFGTDGATADSVNATPPYSSASPVAIADGNPIYVQLYYMQGVLNVWLVDAKAGNTFTTSYDVPDLVSIVGGSSALVGFTAGDGGAESTQTVSDFVFSYTTPPILTISQPGGTGPVIASWPVSVSTQFVLQTSGSINGPWAKVGASPVIANSQNQVTLPYQTDNAVFYRLVMGSPPLALP